MNPRIDDIVSIHQDYTFEQISVLIFLFDGHKQNADRLGRIDSNIDKIEEKVQSQQIEIRVLKNVK